MSEPGKETRQRKRIREAVESRGYYVDELEWEAPYNGGEMSGWCGGWTLTLDRAYLENSFPGNDFYALSTDELLADVDYWLVPVVPCSCDRSHSATMAARVINDPQKPTHDPSG